MPGTDAALLSNGNFYFMGPHAERPVACRTSFQEYSHKNARSHGCDVDPILVDNGREEVCAGCTAGDRMMKLLPSSCAEQRIVWLQWTDDDLRRGLGMSPIA